MEVRAAQHSDIPDLAELWAAAFPGERTVEQRVRQLEAGGVYGGIETAFVATEGGIILGAFRPYRLLQNMHGCVLPMMGVAAVAVAAQARRRGFGSELCRIALRQSYERGDVLSVLYPFRPSFYEALGWGLVGAMHRFTFAPESLPVTHAQPRVRPVAVAKDLIVPSYDRAAAASNGLIQRTPRIWRQHLEWPSVHTVALERAGECAGYAIVHHGHGSAGEGVLTIRELIANDDDAYDELLSWVSLQREHWRLVHYDALPSEHFDLRLVEPRTPGAPPARTLYAHVASVIRGPMLRVVNVQKAVTERRDWGHARLTLRLSIADGDLPQNAEPFTVLFEDGVATIGDSVGAALVPDAEIETDAPTFAQLYAGEILPSDAVRLRRARVTGDVQSIDDVFRVAREFRLLDEF